jgi:hypothetical protein
MTLTYTAGLFLIIATLAGCQQTDGPIELCQVDDIMPYIGEHKDILEQLDLAEGSRVLMEGQPMTMDYRSTRTNIELDEAERIKRVWCG